MTTFSAMTIADDLATILERVEAPSMSEKDRAVAALLSSAIRLVIDLVKNGHDPIPVIERIRTSIGPIETIDGEVQQAIEGRWPEKKV